MSTKNAHIDLHQDPTQKAIPEGLNRLFKLGYFFGDPDSNLPKNLRAVISVPTERLASTALSLGALKVDWGCDERCTHRITSSEPAMAALYCDNRLLDQNVWLDSKKNCIQTQPVSKPLSTRGTHLLPDNFPKRSALPKGKTFEAEIGDLAVALESTPTVAGVERSDLGVHPVIVAGYVSDALKDVRMNLSPLRNFHPLGYLAPGNFGAAKSPGWFRHPVLVCQKIPSATAGFEWLTQVRPRLIVFVGMSAVVSSARTIWPSTPAVIVLDRRSRVSADFMESIDEHGWEKVDESVIASFGSFSNQGDGIEISYWQEMGVRTRVKTEEDEAEW